MKNEPDTAKKPGVETRDVVPYKLIIPIEIAGATVADVKIRRPKVRDLMAVKRQHPDSDDEQELLLAANLMGLAPSEVEDMSLADFKAIGAIIQSFVTAR